MRERTALLLFVFASALVAVLALVRMLFATAVAPQRAWLLARSFDQLANTIFNGDTDETISSRAGKAQLAGRRWGCVLCKLLDKIDPGHCPRYIEPDRGRRPPYEV